MKKPNGIAWTDETWNPVRGCSRVSAGCDNCYAMGQAHRFSGPGKPYDGLTTIRRGKVDWTGSARFHPEMLSQPLRWKRPRRIFVNSMSDLFHESLSFEEIAAVFGVMAASPQHTFQVLTKRPKRALAFFEWLLSHPEDIGPVLQVSAGPYWPDTGYDDQLELIGQIYAEDGEDWPLTNVHLGVSVEDQKTAEERIPLLLQCPAAVRWVSAEPLLGPVDLERFSRKTCARCGERYSRNDFYNFCYDECAPGAGSMGHCGGDLLSGLDWVVVGGESGPGARPCNVEWIRSIVSQCKDAGVPVFVKQMGALVHQTVNGTNVRRLFMHKKGADPNEWPEDLRVQQFPTEKP